LWAVNGVSFQVQAGQSIGIVGRNGSGKSTLMKVIARILQPDTGRITVRGRVSALLELGAGFHPDLTGRENIYLNASVLGLKRKEIDRHFDSVVAFSELGDFINMPVKHYSSGMYMRLGFSVAVHVSPDLLIIDEILAVGDQRFQEKCVAHILEMQKRGVTIVLVSHHMDTVRKLCTHLAWLENGRLMAFGPADHVAQQYLELMYQVAPHILPDSVRGVERHGNGEVEINAVRFLDRDGAERDNFRTGEPLSLEIGWQAHVPVAEIEVGIRFNREDGLVVSTPNSRLDGLAGAVPVGSGGVRYWLEALSLLPGRYAVSLMLRDARRGLVCDHYEKGWLLEVTPTGWEQQEGVVVLPGHWEMVL
jgi:ABC-type polysaccharide/polyol phosphate transport system ATPase subunit